MAALAGELTTVGPARPFVVRRRRPLPGGRAVTGAFLVAVAAVGLFAAYLRATSRPTAGYVVARHALATGQVVQAGDLTMVPLDLGSAAVAAGAFRTTGAVVGRVTLGPLGAGELLQDGGLAAPGRTVGGREVGVPVDANLAGALQAGAWVDVLVTRGSGDTSHTDVVALSARLLDIGRSRSSLGVTSAPVAQLGVPTLDAVKALVQAAHDGPLTLVPSSPPLVSPNNASATTTTSTTAGA